MKYSVWCETFGKYRWYHEDGQSRTYNTLDYEWQKIYDRATKDCDIKFQSYDIEDVDLFTADFLSTVAPAWLKFKTEFELFTGTLDGKTIDPDVFEAGYHKETSQQFNSKSTNSSSSSSVYDDSNTASSAARSINYVQGVQAQNDIVPTDSNIGQMGLNFASNITDSISPKNTSTSNSETETTADDNSNSSASFSETVHQTNINYYDNLAFLRDRYDRLRKLQTLDEILVKCFRNITSYKPWYLRRYNTFC